MKLLTKLTLADLILTSTIAVEAGGVRGYFRANDDFSDPYFWAAFTLTGQWR